MFLSLFELLVCSTVVAVPYDQQRFVWTIADRWVAIAFAICCFMSFAAIVLATNYESELYIILLNNIDPMLLDEDFPYRT